MNPLSFIFDFDGTLMDSYAAIVDKVCRLFRGLGFQPDPARVRENALRQDTGCSIRACCEKYGLPPEEILALSRKIPQDLSLIRPMAGCAETLQALHDRSCRLFVYTHRDSTAGAVFEAWGLTKYFEEIVDSSCGFPRKPDSAAIDYLVEKYGLDRSRCFYVGDRSVDVACGKNSRIRTVFFRSAGLNIDSGGADYSIDSLPELISVAEKEGILP